jgi:hypothetical protein
MKATDEQAVLRGSTGEGGDDAARVRTLLEPLRSAPVLVTDADTASAERERIVSRMAATIVAIPGERARRGRARRAAWVLAAAAGVLVVAGTGAWLRYGQTGDTEAGAAVAARGGTTLLEGHIRTDAAATLSSGAFVGEAAFTTPSESSARVVTEGGVLVEVAAATRARVRSASLARVELMDGAVTLEVPPQKPGASVRVVTPDATVTVHGTRFTVAFDAGASTPKTCVKVEHGKVSVARNALDATDRPTSELLTAGQTSGCVPVETTDAAQDRGAIEARRSSGRPAQGSAASQGSVAGQETSTLAQENRLLQEALAAEQSGDMRRAKARLRTLLAKYPRSGFAGEAERALERIEKERPRR